MKPKMAMHRGIFILEIKNLSSRVRTPCLRASSRDIQREQPVSRKFELKACYTRFRK